LSNRLVVAALAVALAGSAFAAPPESHLLPPDQHSSEKARGLARKYADALRELNLGIYHCLPWLVVPNNSIGFFKPKHLASDARYLSLRVFVEQDASPQFTALDFEGRASAMYSRYVGEMLRRMTRDASLRADADVDGFSVIIGWLKQTTQGGQPVHETIAIFADRATAADFLGGRAKIADFAGRTVVLGFDGQQALGPVRLRAWEDNFVRSFQVANYQPTPGVTCR